MAKKKRKNRISRREKTEVIGIIGCGSGVGVTHFSILTANYLTGVLRRNTAVLEWNDSGAFGRMQDICAKKAVRKPENDTFKVFEVSYLKRAGRNELHNCMNCGFDTVIIDFGSGQSKAAEEILRCDRRFLVGSFSEWQAGAFAGFAAERGERRERWEYFYVFGSEEAAREMRRRLHISIRKIPESRSAFIITEEQMAFFEGFLD